MRKLGFIVILLLVTFIGGSIFGYTKGKEKNLPPEVSAETLVQTLQKQGFLVTQTAVLQEHVEIKSGSGNAFKDFFLGQTIDAYAMLSVDMGIDLAILTEDDIVIDNTSLQIRLPEIEARPAKLVGSINLHNKQGIIKRLVDNDDGYNNAIALLKEKAETAAQSDDIQNNAKDQAVTQLEDILGLLDIDKDIVILE